MLADCTRIRIEGHWSKKTRVERHRGTASVDVPLSFCINNNNIKCTYSYTKDKTSGGLGHCRSCNQFHFQCTYPLCLVGLLLSLLKITSVRNCPCLHKLHGVRSLL